MIRTLGAITLAVLVFSADTLLKLQAGSALLYLCVLWLGGYGAERRRVYFWALCCGILACISFVLTHGAHTPIEAAVRLMTSLSVIGFGCILLVNQGKLLRANAHAMALKDELETRVAERTHDLKLSEHRYRSIFEQSHIGLFELDMRPLKMLLESVRARGVTDLEAFVTDNPEFRRQCAEAAIIIDANDATVRMLGGVRKADILGPIAPFVRATGGMGLDRILALFIRAPSYQGTVRMNRLDGTPLTVLYGLVYPSDEDGFERIVAGMVDITERERAQYLLLTAREDLSRATRAAALGALSASIAHDLNQPIGALVMDAQSAMRWLEREPADMMAARRALERVVRNGNRASEIASRTRRKLVEGRRTVTSVDLRELAFETRDLLQHELEGSEVTLQVAKGDRVPTVDADRNELQQVLVNLILNAAQATVAGGRMPRMIGVSIRKVADGDVRLTVTDNGAGISEEDLPRLFDPFFSTKAQGMGMGLAICRSTIAAFGGTLGAENRTEGGAEFWFSLSPSKTGEPECLPKIRAVP